MTVKPKPFTTWAFLPSRGYGRPRATLHKYTETREASISKESSGKVDGYEFIFTCTETGVERRWGTTNLRIGVTN